MKALPHSWFRESALMLAPKLLGKIIKKGSCAGIIVETEAYGTDPASHAFKITPRSAPMRDTYGHWYIYFTYGMLWCANVTADAKGVGAVLIRAVEPIDGIVLMQKRRTRKGRSDLPFRALCSGPAKLCQAFGITGKENGLLVRNDFAIYDAPEIAKSKIVASTRIGISKGSELPWRFYIKNNPFASR